MVLDFVNKADDIQDYYKTTILSEGTDPNKLYDLQDTLDEFDLYTKDQVAGIAEL